MGGLIDTLRSWFRSSGSVRTPQEFERLFRLFRDLMESNTHALEIISDVGDILGGDYLFDIQYVRRSRDELHARMERSLRLFDELTAGRYAELSSVLGRIEGDIAAGVNGGPPASGPLVMLLEEVEHGMSALAGGKMANLAEVRRVLPAGVPRAFVVTTAAFDAFLKHNGLSAMDAAEGQAWRQKVLQGEVPPELRRVMNNAVRAVNASCGGTCMLAARSSASEEDGELTFAGQFRTVLNVPAEAEAVERAYREVIAGLFSEQAAAYLRRFGFGAGSIKMAVGFVAMVDAVSSGVLYTAHPGDEFDGMVISASWGLGTSVVDARTDADEFLVSRSGAIARQRIGRKDTMTVRRLDGGIRTAEVAAGRRDMPSIAAEQVRELVRAGLALERNFRGPQDVEWAYDAAGRLFILQARPLRTAQQAKTRPVPASGDARRIAFKNAGIVVQQGRAAGHVHIARSFRDLDAVPRGAVLVVNRDAPELVRVMPRVSAIITDRGSLTSHMASLAREFRVPTVVNTGDATLVLAAGSGITVVLDGGVAVYEGMSAAEDPASGPADMDGLYEFRRKRYLLRFITPLNLVDPFHDDFSPGSCRTLHDILRFIHEKAVGRLIGASGFGTRSAQAVKLALAVPAGITAIDIGGGLREHPTGGAAGMDQVASVPFRSILAGMVHPGMWRSDAVPLTVNDFLTSMFRAPDVVAESERQAGSNVAVISREYVNLNIKFGYHYTIIDSYVSGVPRSNHIYFRFAGGATDLSKRSRRLLVIAAILEERGFALSVKGDMLIARLSNMNAEDMEARLEVIGRLIAYTRQLDAVLRDDADVKRCISEFQAAADGSPVPQRPGA